MRVSAKILPHSNRRQNSSSSQLVFSVFSESKAVVSGSVSRLPFIFGPTCTVVRALQNIFSQHGILEMTPQTVRFADPQMVSAHDVMFEPRELQLVLKLFLNENSMSVQIMKEKVKNTKKLEQKGLIIREVYGFRTNFA